MPVAYNLGLLLASPLLALYLCHRILVRGKSRAGFSQRLGWTPRLPPPGPAGRVWLHAVSAGEVVAAAAIARRLAELSPAPEVVVSTTTPAGRQQAEKLLAGARARFYFPFDLLPCAALALRRTRPTVVAAVETEVWPNWLWLARVSGIRTALVNGQFADRGFRGARRARWLYRWALGQIDALWMQTERAAERARFLGAPAGRVRVVGSAKFEQEVPPLPRATADLVSAALGRERGRPLWIAASTHPGEEEQVLAAFRAARARVPELALLLAPRHVERAAAVGALLDESGWRWARRSRAGDSDGAEADVLLLDTMGELSGLYALADVVFLGGSLVPIGGHDLLQPLFHGRPTLFGPHMHNQRDAADAALEAGAAAVVTGPEQLAGQVARLLADREAAAAMSAAGTRLLQGNAGAARECARLLASLARGERAPDVEPTPGC